MPDAFVDALYAAAQKKGGPLSDEEKAAIHKTFQHGSPEQLRARFLNVIRLAGYKGGAPEAICAEWFPKYMAGNIGQFVKMLEDYERSKGDPE